MRLFLHALMWNDSTKLRVDIILREYLTEIGKSAQRIFTGDLFVCVCHGIPLITYAWPSINFQICGTRTCCVNLYPGCNMVPPRRRLDCFPAASLPSLLKTVLSGHEVLILFSAHSAKAFIYCPSYSVSRSVSCFGFLVVWDLHAFSLFSPHLTPCNTLAMILHHILDLPVCFLLSLYLFV